MLKSPVNMACEFSFDSLDIIGFICWIKFSIVGFELLFSGGSVDVANYNFIICVFMEYIYKKTFPNI